jgi:hypothetical protein
MNKRKGIEEITNILSRALRHEIGSKVIEDPYRKDKYAKDAEILFNEALKIAQRFNFNELDFAQIKRTLKSKLNNELEGKDFIPDSKFELIDKTIESAISRLNLI